MTELFEPIAIIGVAGRFPGAGDVRQFWHNLRDGRESVSFLSDDELLANGVTPEQLASPSYVKAVPLLPDVDMFDAELFGFTPNDAEVCDPQLRVFLEVVHTAIEDAGYDPFGIGGTVGVFGSTGANRYPDWYVQKGAKYQRDPLNLWTLNNIDYLSTMVSYKFNFHGPSFTMGTACSSSLTAVHLACQSIRIGECDVAVAGGSTVLLPYGHGHVWTPGAVFTPDGHCRPFDAAGGGTIFGSGAAAVLLKRLSDAVADGDNIHAVIRGTAINNDGSDKVSFTGPSVTGQAAAIMEAMTLADCAPRDIASIEAHGTGTALGDPVELAALRQAYQALGGEPPEPGSIAVGSVKSNVGHLSWASGIAGLMKAVLALENREIPPSINYSTPNPKLELAGSPFFVNDSLRPWPSESGRPRRAAVNSLGVGGTNAHVVLEEGPRPVPAPPETRPRVVVWSARNANAVTAVRGELAGYFAERGEDTFAGAVATLQRGRTAHGIRQAVVCDSAAEAAATLAGGDLVTGVERAAPRDVVFLFPGQGSQHPRMAAGLYGRQRVFTETMDLCLEAFERAGIPLYDVWLTGSEDEAEQTRHAQPLLFAVEYALAKTWLAWGVTPRAVLGHSVGELVAATMAGVFTEEDAARLVAARAEAMHAMPPGGMLALPLPESRVRELLPESVCVAVVNPGPQTVVAGTREDLSALADRLRAEGVSSRPLRASHAFHSPAMRDAVARFADAFAGVDLRTPTLPVYSAATGVPLSDAEAVDPYFWARQLAEPVWFTRALDQVTGAGNDLLLEVGPGRALTRLARKHTATEGRAFASLAAPRPGGQDDERNLLSAVAALWVTGVPVDWAAIDDGEPWQRTVLPGYQYQRSRHWVDPLDGPAAPYRAEERPAAAPSAPAEPAVDEQAAAAPLSVLSWVEEARPPVGTPSGAGAHALALLPPSQDASLPLLGVLQQAGHRVLRVRAEDAFRADGDEFGVRPGEPEDMRRLVDELQSSGRLPTLLVHAWCAEPWPRAGVETADEQLDKAFFGLVALVQEISRRPVPTPRLLAVTTRSVDVGGTEPVDPVKAVTHGLVRTLALESPTLSCRLIDVGAGVSEDDLIDEVCLAGGAELVALRGARRWVRVERPYEPVAAPAPVRRAGVYVITGGLGGLGLAVAKGLARTGKRPKLVLLGRTGVAAEDEARHGARWPAIRAAIDEMTALGAQVRVIACDVADERAVRRAMDIVAAQVGQPNGVLHLAGVPGDGMIQLRSLDAARDVLRPKVAGTLVLEKVLAALPPLDFFVSFSSRAAVTGLIGSGDYAAANAFLDAWSAAPGGARRLSLNWPSWAGAGMAAGPVQKAPARPAPADDADHVHAFTMAAEDYWALDDHRIGHEAVLPGTAHLDFVIRAFRRDILGAEPPVVLEDVVFERPLVGDVPRAVEIRFQKTAARYRFRVLSRPVGGDQDDWLCHVTGHVAAYEGPGRTVPIDEVRRDLRVAPTPSLDLGPNRLFSLGPRWHGVEGVRVGDGVKLVEFSLPEPFLADLPEHAIHPAMLDVTTALIRDDTDGMHLPFLYERLVVHERMPRTVSSHMRRRPRSTGIIVGDIDLVAPDGQVVIEITGFTMRATEMAAFTGGSLKAATAREPRQPSAAEGLDPDAAVDLFLALLGARTPAQVLVRPAGDGLPLAAPVAAPRPAVVVAAPVTVARPAPVPVAAEPEPAAVSVDTELRRVWQEVLGVSELDPHGDFFDIGGDSLTAVQLMDRLREALGVELSIGILFDHPTLGDLVDVVKQQVAE